MPSPDVSLGTSVSVTIYAGNAGDRNPRGMRGAIALGNLLARTLDLEPCVIGCPVPPLVGGWVVQLRAAMPNLRLLSTAFDRQLREGTIPVVTMGRCAAALATLPLVARQHPDAVIIWFDAHGDCNAPTTVSTADTSYLGGMVLTGAAGEWDTGLGAGLNFSNVILVAARDLDPPERQRIEAGTITLVSPGHHLGERLKRAIAGRPVYVHLDCDVLTAGLLATEYQVLGGLTFEELHVAFRMLGEHQLLGVEIAECEDSWPDGRANDLRTLAAVICSLFEESSRGATNCSQMKRSGNKSSRSRIAAKH